MLFYNEDWMHFIWTRYEAGIEVTEELLRDYIYSFKGTQVTDFAFNVNGTTSTAPSKVLKTFADKYLTKEENGYAVDYTDSLAKSIYMLEQKGIDMYSVWIDALRETGINPWLSIRVNDCHCNFEKTNIRKSTFVEEYSQYHVAAYRERTGYFDKCFDYTYEEVRNKALEYIDEMLSRYDVYGLELDFTREMVLFRSGFEHQGQKLITEFIEKVYALLNKYGKKYNHKIKLSLLLYPSPSDCMERGVNVFDFTDKIDFITIISRWETSNTDMPIELWKQLLHNTNIKLGGGQQLLISPSRERYFKNQTISSVKMAFGQAIANLSRGCDFVYLYNYMDFGNYEGAIADWIYDESIRNDANRALIFNNIGKPETLLKQERSHVVTYNDFPAILRDIHSVLPISFNEDSCEYERIRIAVGEIPHNKRARLIIGTDTQLPSEAVSIYVNSAECEYGGEVSLDSHIYDKYCYAFDINKNLFDIMIAEIRIKYDCKVEYVEVEIKNV